MKKRRGARYVARLDGDALVVAHDAKLPAVCLKCGSHDGILRRPTTFYWSPAWARYLIFCGIGVLIALFTREEAELAVPLCPPCNARWDAARQANIAGLLAVVAAVFGVRYTKSPPIVMVPVLLVAAVIVFFVVRFSRRRVLRAKKITADHEMFLLGVAPSAAKELEEGSTSVAEQVADPQD